MCLLISQYAVSGVSQPLLFLLSGVTPPPSPKHLPLCTTLQTLKVTTKRSQFNTICLLYKLEAQVALTFNVGGGGGGGGGEG